MIIATCRAAAVVAGFLFASLALSAAEPSSQPTTGATTQSSRQPAKRFLLRYKLSDGNGKWPADKRKAIVDAMDAAVALYNQEGDFDKLVTANYRPGTPTADANYNGWINFGGQIGRRTALHEIAHTLGVGTQGRYHALLKDGKWTGEGANALLKTFDGPDAVLKGDRQHFWPYGLNFETESSPEKDRRHVKMVAALRADMGILNGEDVSKED